MSSKSGNDGNDGNDDKEGGKLIPIKGGKTIDPKDIGAKYIISASNHVSTGEITDPVEAAKNLQNRVAYVKRQEIVRVLDDSSSTSKAIDAVLKEIAEELSHLKWERRQAARDNKSTASYTTARVSGLRSLAEMLVKRKEILSSDHVDIKSERFQKIFALWMNFFYDSMTKSGISKEVIDVVFQQMKADMMDWEKKMEAVE